MISYTNPIINIRRFSRKDVIQMSDVDQNASINQQANYILNVKRATDNATSVDVRKMKVNIDQ